VREHDLRAGPTSSRLIASKPALSCSAMEKRI
jgi:hypothetical protein